MKLILASNNAGKVREIRGLLPRAEIRSLRDIGYSDPIPEPFETFHENARIKAQTIHDRYPAGWVLADDSGICVAALHGAPGVFSARFAGDGATDAMNNELLLRRLAGVQERSAWYVAVLCLISPDGDVYFFEGRCDGHIGTELMGEGGFGYDPLFIPAGHVQSFGQLPDELKRQISHRARALKALLDSGLLQTNA